MTSEPASRRWNEVRRLPPIDTLKIDRSFVEGLDHEPADTAIVAAVIGLAKGLVQPTGMGGKAPRPILIVALALPDEDALRVGAQAVQPRNDGIGGGVFGAEDQRVGRAGTGAAIGKRPACAQARAQVEHEQRFAQV